MRSYARLVDSLLRFVAVFKPFSPSPSPPNFYKYIIHNTCTHSSTCTLTPCLLSNYTAFQVETMSTRSYSEIHSHSHFLQEHNHSSYQTAHTASKSIHSYEWLSHVSDSCTWPEVLHVDSHPGVFTTCSLSYKNNHRQLAKCRVHHFSRYLLPKTRTAVLVLSLWPSFLANSLWRKLHGVIWSIIYGNIH